MTVLDDSQTCSTNPRANVYPAGRYLKYLAFLENQRAPRLTTMWLNNTEQSYL